ncbi:CAP domain-containing protein [Persicimonas caeni]|uniref:CAP domain-containing protein n=1 Tax=Persicimonas caeni TaxID=2292766 RepID=A0A4Y6PNW9_PERCE|nr:CAP domain-containing protein [Persicimonas caeni]QDG49893.1 CAP domain-containing protein [Persicimonas caeni]QED31114.1 CAP domain-containing protein [Persicimonas caeni]
MKYALLILALVLTVTACQTMGQRTVTTQGDIPKTRTSGNPLADCTNTTTRRVVELANDARDDEGLNELYCDRALARVAQRHAQDMCDHNYLSHTSRDGRTMVDRVDEAGIDYMALGENVAMGQRTPERVHTGWMDSEYHRANILNDMFSRLGVGYVECGGQPYWVQVFAN